MEIDDSSSHPSDDGVWWSDTPEWLKGVYEAADYDSEVEGSRPVKDKWPAKSELSRDHFVIDQQRCLKCSKKLPWNMPMNKIPNPHFLFCCDDDGKSICKIECRSLPCCRCGNLTHVDLNGSLGFQLANSGYCGPAQLYFFICNSCHRDEVANAPSDDDVKERMRVIKELRKSGESDCPGECNSRKRKVTISAGNNPLKKILK